jgi:hypothetical protein
MQRLRGQRAEELDRYCRDLIDPVNAKLLPAADGVNSRVFYVRMTEDYSRYISESKRGPDRAASADEAKRCDEEAISVARERISQWMPAFLGLILNYSVYLYEIVSLEKEAVTVAQMPQEVFASGLGNNRPEAFTEATRKLYYSPSAKTSNCRRSSGRPNKQEELCATISASEGETKNRKWRETAVGNEQCHHLLRIKQAINTENIRFPFYGLPRRYIVLWTSRKGTPAIQYLFVMW